MRKTSISNKLIHKPQAHSQGRRVYEENNELKLELEKNKILVKYFAVKGSTVEE